MKNNSKSNCKEKDKDQEDQALKKILESCKDTGNLNT